VESSGFVPAAVKVVSCDQKGAVPLPICLGVRFSFLVSVLRRNARDSRQN